MRAPYGFSQTEVGLIFSISLVGILSSAWVGDVASRIGRTRIFPALVILILVSVALTLAASLYAILGGMALLTFAFYGAHTVASSQVGQQARVAKAQASSLYLFSYYSGSSLIGSLGGIAFERDGRNGLVGLCSLVLVAALALALTMLRTA